MNTDHAIVIASDTEHPGMARVWGSGAWTPPGEREARDWFTLCRLLGWEARLETPRLGRVGDGARWVLVACDPAEVSDGLAGALDAFLDQSPGLVVMNAPRRQPDITGRTLRWLGPGEGATWKLEHDLHATRLEGDGDPWLTLDDAPVALAERRERGTLVTLGFHPSEARDAGIAATAALRTLLTRGPAGGTAWLDTDGLFALRMDDPGGSQNVHLDWFRYPELGPATWHELAALLRERNAQLGVAAVPGWADDGEDARGELLVGGEKCERAAGRIHPSWEVTYRDRAGVLHDYVGEFEALRELAREGLVDIALHGLTHVRPDTQAWVAADDRYSADWWYCEFAAAGPEARARLDTGTSMLGEYFGSRPDVFVFPQDMWTQPAIECALEVDLEMIASYYVALRDGGRWVWAEQVCAPYLNEPDPKWFEAGVPVVGYFHARDVALHGLDWVRDHLDAWSAAGAQRMIGLGELASILGSGAKTR